ncbi:hypothetical protein POTOM_055147 [Populus tomentosa]|uniref:Serpin domain-containing protein n=1 Tax=Populus tomentosa TaxID=118781 RepID=A0A8X7Y2U6_POPTO|nr:hypothetical protein POTOM_055147 [Populus tomentosa]
MYFFLPEATDGLHSLIQVFKSSPELYTMKFKLREEDLPEFWIPRFKFSFKFKASKTMKELGLELPFKAVRELSEMVDSAKSLFLSNVFHASCIEGGEIGNDILHRSCDQPSLDVLKCSQDNASEKKLHHSKMVHCLVVDGNITLLNRNSL